MTKLAAALALAERGFHVFPVKAGKKFPPLWRDWPNRATNTPNRANWPVDANVAIHPKGLVVLDVDVRGNGGETLALIEKERGLPRTLTTRTPTGGSHLFYRLPEGHPGVPNGSNRLGQGVDVKSTNGYVLAPGSEVEAGRYRFEADVPIADAPEWLLLELGTTVPKTGMSTNDGQKEIVDAPAEVVQRAREWLKGRPVGDEAYATACGLRDFGLSRAQALYLLSDHDGRDVSILGAKIDHAYRYAQNAPGSKAASAAEFPVVADAPVYSKRERSKPKKLHELAAAKSNPYLVKGFLQLRSHAVLYGAPGQGKTFVALDLAYHVAAGKEWQGRRVKQGTVLYLAFEGIGGMAKRAAAITKFYEPPLDLPLYVLGADHNLREPVGRKALAEDMAHLPEKPKLIVIDTLARAMKGGDENSAQDMGALNDAVGALIEATGACVLLLHHSGKNKAAGARGSSALLGAIDTEIEIDSRRLISRKQRDVELGEALGFALMPVAVGEDEDGDLILSCVVEPAAPLVDPSYGLRGESLLAWRALCESGDNEPVAPATWRAACAAFLPRGYAAKRRAFFEQVEFLKGRGLIEDKSGMIARKMA